MEKFTVTISLELDEIQRAYKHHFGLSKNPTRHQLATWIGHLAQADIESEAAHTKKDEDD